MGLRWKVGVYLGQSSNSSEAYVGKRNGNVAKVRSVVQVIDAHKWNKTSIENVQGTPGDMQPVPDESPTADDLERTELPHEYEGREVDPEASGERRPQQGDAEDFDSGDRSGHHGPRRVRITQKDLDAEGYTGGCPRCADLEYGLAKTKKTHN